MAEKSNHNSQFAEDNYLREIRDALVGIHDILLKEQSNKKVCMDSIKSKMDQHKMLPDVFISRAVVLERLGVGQTTLIKWRQQNCLKYKKCAPRLIMYSYIELMDALANGRLVARGFSPLAAYKRLLEWYNDNVGNDGQG